eukprot:Opistho-2@47640
MLLEAEYRGRRKEPAQRVEFGRSVGAARTKTDGIHGRNKSRQANESPSEIGGTNGEVHTVERRKLWNGQIHLVDVCEIGISRRKANDATAGLECGRADLDELRRHGSKRNGCLADVKSGLEARVVSIDDGTVGVAGSRLRGPCNSATAEADDLRVTDSCRQNGTLERIVSPECDRPLGLLRRIESSNVRHTPRVRVDCNTSAVVKRLRRLENDSIISALRQSDRGTATPDVQLHLVQGAVVHEGPHWQGRHEGAVAASALVVARSKNDVEPSANERDCVEIRSGALVLVVFAVHADNEWVVLLQGREHDGDVKVVVVGRRLDSEEIVLLEDGLDDACARDVVVGAAANADGLDAHVGNVDKLAVAARNTETTLALVVVRLVDANAVVEARVGRALIESFLACLALGGATAGALGLSIDNSALPLKLTRIGLAEKALGARRATPADAARARV